jgi:hypothetical protein
MLARAAAQFLILAWLGARAGAQATTSTNDTAKARAGGLMVGYVLGMPGTRREPIPALFTAGVSFTQIHPNHIGADVSVGTMPFLLPFGVIPLGLRLGVALPVSVAPHLLLIPSTGLSLVGAFGQTGGGGLAGLNVGASAVSYIEQVGVKASLTWHGFSGMEGPVWLVELGVVNVPVGLP